jgi:hypothetical protein
MPPGLGNVGTNFNDDFINNDHIKLKGCAVLPAQPANIITVNKCKTSISASLAGMQYLTPT